MKKICMKQSCPPPCQINEGFVLQVSLSGFPLAALGTEKEVEEAGPGLPIAT